MADTAEFSPAVRRLVLARSGGACEGCGRVVGLELHHRLFRSRGGLGGPENALALCGFGNTGGCHGRAHSGAGPGLGWAVSAGADPAEVPVSLPRFGRVLLDVEGRVLRADGWPCWAHSAGGAVRGCSLCRWPGEVLWELEEEKGWWS